MFLKKEPKIYEVVVSLHNFTELERYWSFWPEVENNGDMRFVSFYTTTGHVLIKAEYVDSVIFNERNAEKEDS